MTAPLTDAQRALVEQVAHYAPATVARRALAPRMRQEWEDMVGECYLALCRAAVAYDSTGGRKWHTYAIACVRHIPTEYLRREDRLGRYQRDREDRRIHAISVLKARLERTPRPDEIAAALGITEEQAEEWRTRANLASAWRDAWRMHEPVGVGERSFERHDTHEDQIPDDAPTPEQIALQRDLVAQVRQAIDRIPTEIKRIVARRVLLDGEPMKAVAVEVGRSESRVHQIVQETREYLREFLVPLEEERGK